MTKSELEEKKQRTAELETQVSHPSEPSLSSGEQPLWQADCIHCVPAFDNPRAVLTWRCLLRATPPASKHTSCPYNVNSAGCWIARHTDQTVHASAVYVSRALGMH